jgi:phosphohistidine phosphatase
MNLFLVRHADASPGTPDELRPLSGEGREQARRLGEQLKRDGIEPDVILTSPLLRARETGEALARATGSTAVADERLAPGATVDDVRTSVRGRGEQVVVVGHQPDCGHIAAALSGGEERSFAPAAMAVFELL